MEWLTPTFLWTMGIGTLALGAAYGELLLRAKSNTDAIAVVKNEAFSRIDTVKRESQDEQDELKAALTRLADLHIEHRRETTDRLARIETKIDNLLGER